jgi:hypothetical protein
MADRIRASDEIAVVGTPVDPADSAAVSHSAADEPGGSGVPAAFAVSPHDAITRPVAFPPPPAPEPPPVPAEEHEHDAGWDLGDEDPTAASEPAEKPEITTPSSSEMAGDGAVEGDGIDTGWD